MDAKTLTALEDSVAHWKRMAEGKANEGERPGGDQCALCQLFCQVGSKYCDGCPVNIETECSCDTTPYFKAEDAFYAFGINSPKFKAAAAKELAFLQSLLPKVKPAI